MKKTIEVWQTIPDYLIPLNDMEEKEWEKEFEICFQVEVLEEEGTWEQPPVFETKILSHECFEDGKKVVEGWEWFDDDSLQKVFETIDQEEFIN